MQKADIRSDYLSGAEALRPFYSHPLGQVDYTAMMRAKGAEKMDRELLSSALREQYAGLADADLSLANIALMEKENTFTVTTGHQLCLMGGPLYLVYKIITAIRLAQVISEAHPEANIVPVFWMATEDHDWEEINHFYTDFDQKHSYTGTFSGPVGRHLLEPDILKAFPDQVPAELAAIFAPGKKYADAFREFIHRLFGRYGLVIVDGDDPVLKRRFLPWMLKELDGSGMVKPIRETDERLEALGYKRQIHTRDINLFYLGGEGRELILREEEGFATRSGMAKWSGEDLRTMMEVRPEDFSPNVAMRPLYQEVLLPNLAYVGGWAELSYWLQLKAAFDVAEVCFPLLAPRMSATLFRAGQARDWDALGFAPADIDLPLHQLLDSYLDRNWDESELAGRMAGLLSAYEQLAEYAASIEATQAISVRAERAKAEKSLEKLRKKLRKSIRNKEPQAYRAIESLKNAIQPEGKRQERILNFTTFAGEAFDQWIAGIYEHCDPENYQELWITKD